MPMIALSLKSETDVNVKNEKCMYAMVAFGIGEIFGALFIG